MVGSLNVLLPPSEGKAEGGRPGRGGGSLGRSLSRSRGLVVEALAEELAHASEQQITTLLGVRGALLQRARAASELVIAGRAPQLPAWQRYTGVVWTHLDPASLGREELGRILVPSGLYGLSSGLDPVADYRLKMSASLGELGRLSTYWRDELSALLGRRYGGRTLVNLLPAEHAAAFDWAQVAEACELVEVRFLARGGRAAAGHDAKAVKGALARELLLKGEAALRGFRYQGWHTRLKGGHVEVLAP